MTTAAAAALSRIRATPCAAGTEGLLSFLDRPDLQLVTERVVMTTVRDALHLWRTRQRIGRDAGARLDGVDDLVRSLAKLHGDLRLRQFGFKTAGQTFVVLVNPADDQVVGFAGGRPKLPNGR